MGNTTEGISKGGFGMLSAGKFEETKKWIDKTAWKQEDLEEKVRKKECVPFEKPSYLSEERSGYEKCTVCMLYFRLGLNHCTNCSIDVCSHCFFKVKIPPRLFVYYGDSEKKTEVGRDWIDDSECVFCEDTPWEIYTGPKRKEKDPLKILSVEKVEEQKKVMEESQKMAIEIFKDIQEKKKVSEKKTKKAKKKKKKPKQVPQQAKPDDDAERMKEQMEKMLPKDIDINDLVETEEKMMEAALEREMEKGNELEIDGPQYKKIKKTVTMAMYGTVKNLKVSELRDMYAPKQKKEEKPTKKVLFQKEKKEEGESEGGDGGFYDFVL